VAQFELSVSVPHVIESESLRHVEIGDSVDLVGRQPEVFDRHGDISTAEEIQQGIDVPGLCCSAQPGGQVVTVVDRDRAMLGEPEIIGWPSDAENRGPSARASCTAIEPTPPAAPAIATVSPGTRRTARTAA
jgi:hypothetical protein